MNRLGYIIFILSTLITANAQAQDHYKKSSYTKELKSNMKAAAYAKVVSTVKDAIRKYPEQAGTDPEFYHYSLLANQALALEEAKKMYLHQKADTLKYFDYVYAVYTNGLVCDSLSNIPDAKGKVNTSYRKSIVTHFVQNIEKLPAAAKFAVQKKEYTRAYNFADMFISLCSDSSAYKPNLKQVKAETEILPLSAIAVLSAYAQNDYRKALIHMPQALAESNRRQQILEVACRCYEQLKDTVGLEKHLLDGVESYPSSKFFFFTLVKLYNDQQRYDNALDVTNEMLQYDSRNRDFWYIRGKEEAYLNRHDDALQSFTTATEIKNDDAESYSAIGNIYLERSHELYDHQKTLKGQGLQTVKDELHSLYMKSKTAFENARKYDGQNTSLWLSGLKELYYKLNMGKELNAIELIK